MPDFSQAARAFRFESPLGGDALMLTSFVGEEATSRPFLYTVELVSENRAIVAEDILGKEISLVFELESGERFVRGVVRQFTRLGGRNAKLFAYRAEVVPWLWLATLRSDIRSFQQKSVPEMVQAVLQPHSTNVRLALTADYPPRDYCVQYRETDFDFVSRLMEEEGIAYFFEHTESELTMVLTDAPSALKTAWQAEAKMREGNDSIDNVVTDIVEEFAVQSDKVTVSTYHFETPSVDKKASESTPSQSGARERYELVSAYDRNGSDGKRHASVRLDEFESATAILRGESTVRAMQAGAKISITGAPSSASQGELHLLSVRHQGENGAFVSEADAIPGGYRNEFVAIPAAAKYRPPRVTPQPRAYGLQTAVVVGPAGEEIYVDTHGRVKVQFHWDRLGKSDDKSSAWVRVSQAWAGKGWGFLAHPRIGQEVIVEFVDGDPDHPVITGRVYNADAVIPYASSASTTQSGIKSRSTKQGGDDEFNEIRFDDKKGSEEFSTQAQKDLKVLVKNDETREVRHDRITTITNDDTRTILEGNDTLAIKKGAQLVTIDKGDQAIAILEGTHELSVKRDHTVTVVSGNHAFEVTEGNAETTIGTGDLSTTVKTGDMKTKVSTGNHTLEVSSGDLETKVSLGNHTTTVSLGNLAQKASVGKVTIEATGGIELKCGANSIVIDQVGVTIKGMLVTVEGQVQTQVKGLIVNVEATAMAVLKGAITMIN